MDLTTKFSQLRSLFSMERRVKVGAGVEIIPFRFVQKVGDGDIVAFQRTITPDSPDNMVMENRAFTYTVFQPENPNPTSAIVLLHGLNERSWDKYLPWADELARSTGKSVILFPIAFHMNRTPSDWYDPRKVAPQVNIRRAADIVNTTFANVAISNRISAQPLRFYSSALETVYNLRQLAGEIRTGAHPLFSVNTSLDIFAYSIGASVAQILLASDCEGRFSDSRLFMFCGGSLVEMMNGCQRDILDSEACRQMTTYLTGDFMTDTTLPEIFRTDTIEQSCKMMICRAQRGEQRTSFFERIATRIKAITLKNDTVVPTAGVSAALGSIASRVVNEMDFQYNYSHQIPFPTSGNTDPDAVNRAFKEVFSCAADFFMGSWS